MATREDNQTGKSTRSKIRSKPSSAKSQRRADSGLADSDEYSSDDYNPAAKKKSKSRSSKSSKRDGGKVKVPIDLTNPDDLLNKMDKLELTEEETEELLKQAYSINRKLKQEMRDAGDYPSTSAKSERLPPIGNGKKRYTTDPHNRNLNSDRRARPSEPSRKSGKPKQRPEWVD